MATACHCKAPCLVCHQGQQDWLVPVFTLILFALHVGAKFFSNVVLEARPWPRGQTFMASASGPMAFSSKVQAMALSCSDNCWRHAQTQGPTTDTKVTVKSVAVSFTFT